MFFQTSVHPWLDFIFREIGLIAGIDRLQGQRDFHRFECAKMLDWSFRFKGHFMCMLSTRPCRNHFPVSSSVGGKINFLIFDLQKRDLIYTSKIPALMILNILLKKKEIFAKVPTCSENKNEDETKMPFILS